MSADYWIQKHAHRLKPGSHILDLACGPGRHSQFFINRGHQVTAIDKHPTHLAQLPKTVTAIKVDLEQGHWPLSSQQFDAIVVVNYLHRPLFAHILQALANGGALLYATFAQGQQAYGHPKNPDFLLRDNELIERVKTQLTIRAYFHGAVKNPQGEIAMRQCIYATRG